MPFTFKLSRQPKRHAPRQPSAKSLARLDKFLKQQAPATHAHKAAKSGFKGTVTAFFQKHFNFKASPQRSDAQQCVVRTVVTQLPGQDLAQNPQYQEALHTLAQPQWTSADTLPFEADANATALANPPVIESAAVSPEPAPTQALENALKDAMQEIYQDMLAKGEDRRTCVLGGRTITARIEMPKKNNPDKQLMFGILDAEAIDSRGKAGINAVLFEGTLHLNGRDVAQHQHPTLALLDVSDAVSVLRLAPPVRQGTLNQSPAL